MSNTKFPYKISIPATSKAEAGQKMKALAQMAGTLDGKTLAALAKKIPVILKDPLKASIVKSQLGL